ncbi:pre-mRNA-splicing factor CWC22 homolog [Dioscorea cayenensis subsp. rotundata]|uniref:Pre-mRNA-splicing factor CWC22 homolog n=1 Tax=Dioscorea cayennensis subsp. rotundata TaxID=55577 RepID=A0AB40BKA8_DIOCR|nr:pre-mRNA-splicing factor CWC22 homolog [Dioscorea cayenensis subsp. rotundata]
MSASHSITDRYDGRRGLEERDREWRSEDRRHRREKHRGEEGEASLRRHEKDLKDDDRHQRDGDSGEEGEASPIRREKNHRWDGGPEEEGEASPPRRDDGGRRRRERGTGEEGREKELEDYGRRRRERETGEVGDTSPRRGQKDRDEDGRRRRERGTGEEGDTSPRRRQKERDDDSRRRRERWTGEEGDTSPRRRQKDGDDHGRRRRERGTGEEGDTSPRRRQGDRDDAGRRRREKGTDEEGDTSPRRRQKDPDNDSRRQREEGDTSPLRREKLRDDNGHHRRERGNGEKSDASPRRREKHEDEDRRRISSRRGENGRGNKAVDGEDEKKPEPTQTKPMPDASNLRTGGVYIPPHKMAQMMRDVQDKSSEAYQRLSWDALRKSINGLVNKVNATNIKNIIPELFSENLIRGRGLFCRSCMKSQMASPGFTDVFAALVAVVNTKFPEVGKLLLKRIVLQLKRAYSRNDKPQLLAATKFIAHLVNQQVAHEIVALELLTVLLENPTDDSVEVAVGFVKECGSLLQDFSPRGLQGIFERFRGILHEGEIDKRVQFLIEGLFAIRKAKFQGFPAIRPELDLVEQEDQFTHEISLEDEVDPETNLDVFKPNPTFLDDEKAYENLKTNILGAESSEDEDNSDAASDDEDDEDDEDEDEDEMMKITDETETNLVNLRRTIYLTIMSSVDFEEAGHKLLKIKLEPGQEMELCIMLLECCSQERTYLRYYGLLGQRFCMINKVYQENFEKCFVQQYSMIHRLETNKLRNVAKFFAHLLGTSALPWHVLAYIRLTEDDTTSSSRIFIKILFQELSEHLGIRLLNERLNEPTMKDSFDSIFPKDHPKNTRFAINFFTSIGLGGITESLREHLKNMPRMIMEQQKQVTDSDESGSDGGSSSLQSGSESGSESESSSDSSERDRRQSKRRKR